MEQRRLRLGDLIDDYCPRERRLSNHVVVAIVDDDVKQTRCTTCDAEHPYKHAKVPARRKRSETAVAAKPPNGLGLKLDDASDAVQEPPAPARSDAVLRPTRPASPVAAPVEALPPSDPAPAADAPAREATRDDASLHRRLIRATLPRPEGQAKERPLPDFTLRLPGARLGPFRHSDQHGLRGPNSGNTNWGNPGNNKPNRPKGNRPKQGNRAGAFAPPGGQHPQRSMTAGHGGRPAQGRPHNKKRSR